MVLHSRGIQIGSAVLMFLSFCGWVVALAGTAHVTNECRVKSDAWVKNPIHREGHIQPFPYATSNASHAYDCGVYYSLDWWIISYQIVIVIFGTLAVFVEYFHAKSTILQLTAISTALFTIYTSIYVKLAYNFSGGMHSDDTIAQGYKTAVAGGILVSISNFAFMFVFGSEEEGTSPPLSG